MTTQPVFDITLQSLNGVTLVSPKSNKRHSDDDIPNVKAAVSFSGSASNMKVGTHVVCPQTGNLMVESNKAVTLRRPSSSSALQPLLACWDDGFHSEQPHLSLSISHQDSGLPSIPVSEANRDSKIVDSFNFYEDLSVENNDPSSSSQEIEDIIWSNESAAMPEIIELNVNLKVGTADVQSKKKNKKEEDTLYDMGEYFDQGAKQDYVSTFSDDLPSMLSEDSEDSFDYFFDDDYNYDARRLEQLRREKEQRQQGRQEEPEEQEETEDYNIGVAYLVLYGKHDRGTTILDLPLKKLRGHHEEKIINNITVDPDATIRIRIDVHPHGKKETSLSSPYLSSPTPRPKQKVQNNNKNIVESAYQNIEDVLREVQVAEDFRNNHIADEYYYRREAKNLEYDSGTLCGFMGMLLSSCHREFNDENDFFDLNNNNRMNTYHGADDFSTIFTTRSTRKMTRTPIFLM